MHRSGSKVTTNTFFFTFTVDSKVEVVPKSYSDAMLYLQGARLRARGVEIAKIQGSGLDCYF